MKVVGAVLALGLALAALYISQVAAGYACDEAVPCTAGSETNVIRLLALAGLVGVLAILILVARNRVRGAAAVAALTAALYGLWIVLLVRQIEGSPPSETSQTYLSTPRPGTTLALNRVAKKVWRANSAYRVDNGGTAFGDWPTVA